MEYQKQWNISIPKKEEVACNLLEENKKRQDKVYGIECSYFQPYKDAKKGDEEKE